MTESSADNLFPYLNVAQFSREAVTACRKLASASLAAS